MSADGFAFVTLGLAPLSRRGGVAPARRLWLRLLLAWIRAHGARFYNFEGLDAFKAKFQPDAWEPIYAISNEPRFSARTLYAVAAAFTEGAPLIAVAGAILAAIRQEWQWLRARSAEERESGAPTPGSAQPQ
jgi:phosphatidylglycerol lysyltransferase